MDVSKFVWKKVDGGRQAISEVEVSFTRDEILHADRNGYSLLDLNIRAPDSIPKDRCVVEVELISDEQEPEIHATEETVDLLSMFSLYSLTAPFLGMSSLDDGAGNTNLTGVIDYADVLSKFEPFQLNDRVSGVGSLDDGSCAVDHTDSIDIDKLLLEIEPLSIKLATAFASLDDGSSSTSCLGQLNLHAMVLALDPMSLNHKYLGFASHDDGNGYRDVLGLIGFARFKHKRIKGPPKPKILQPPRAAIPRSPSSPKYNKEVQVLSRMGGGFVYPYGTRYPNADEIVSAPIFPKLDPLK
eukprot:CAMPEP_0203763130 /NCGR_PEP_ID=MMETSP0098-20131031/15806_1 /ASSEMBLY_ACC=CAM_ASM_000208 /TAXON_ID=96639 /ORGANISM=" , Strain NY0313808BC1" /LENGTH=298 /DNA_ID=CAMNT_0050657739 /DNA_START=3691 /DNA_END=4587 /DNA_ORIENTATION=-